MRFIIFTVFLALLQLNSYSDSVFVKIGPLVVYSCLWFYFFNKNRTFTIRKLVKENVPLFILLAMIYVGQFRTNAPDLSFSFLLNRALSSFVFLLGMATAFDYYKRKKGFTTKDILINFVIKPYLLFAIINIILWMLNVVVKASVVTDEVVNTKAVLLSYVGIHIDRVQFPFAAGFNNYAVIIGGILTFSLSLLFVIKDQKYRGFAIFSSIVSIVTLVLIDSRSALIYPLIISTMLALFKSKAYYWRQLPYYCFILVLGPAILFLITPVIASMTIFESLSRSSEDLATGNSRFFIWAICFSEFINFKTIHLVGYGEFGHFGSGLSKMWAALFSTWEDSEMRTPHNTFFSILLDYGYLGVAIYLGAIYRVFDSAKAVWREDLSGSLLVSGFMIFFLFAGITETLGGFYIPNFFFFVFSGCYFYS